MAGVVTLSHDLVYVGIGKETTFLTQVSPTYFLKIMDAGFLPKNKVDSYRDGNSLDIAFGQKQSFDYDGVVSTYMFPVEFAAIMTWLLGLDTKTGSGDPYTHTITPTATHPFVSTEMSYYETNQIDRVESKISKVVITAETGKDVEVQVTFVGGTIVALIASGSAATVSFSDGDGPMRMADGVFTLTGSTTQDALNLALQVQKYVLTYDRGVTPEHGPGQVQPIQLFGHARKCTLALTCDFSSRSLADLIYYGVNTGGSGVSGVVGTGSASVVFTPPQNSGTHTITIATPQLNWENSKYIGKGDGKTGSIEYDATAILGASPLITVTALNAVSTAF